MFELITITISISASALRTPTVESQLQPGRPRTRGRYDDGPGWERGSQPCYPLLPQPDGKKVAILMLSGKNYKTVDEHKEINEWI